MIGVPARSASSTKYATLRAVSVYRKPADARLQKTAAICDYGYRMAVQARVGTEHLRCELGLKFDEIVAIEQAGKDVLDLVRQPVVGRQGGIEAFGRAGRFGRRRRGFGQRELAKTDANHIEAVFVVLRDVVRHSAGGVMQMRTA